MERRRRGARRSGVARGSLAVVFLVSILFAEVSGCGPTVGHPEEPAKYRDAEVGSARLTADSIPRVHEVVNVTGSYPDPGHRVKGAAVLVDDRIARDAPRTDYRHRPVFVVYVSKVAAMQAVAQHRQITYLREGNRVIYFPRGFPVRARAVYAQGFEAGAGLQ